MRKISLRNARQQLTRKLPVPHALPDLAILRVQKAFEQSGVILKYFLNPVLLVRGKNTSDLAGQVQIHYPVFQYLHCIPSFLRRKRNNCLGSRPGLLLCRLRLCICRVDAACCGLCRAHGSRGLRWERTVAPDKQCGN